MVGSKPFCPPKVNESKNLTDKNKGQSPNYNKCRGKKTQTKSQDSNPEAETNFKGRVSDLEGYIFNLGTRASEKFSRAMKDLERYLVATFGDICEPAIMTEIPATFLNPKTPIFISDMAV